MAAEDSLEAIQARFAAAILTPAASAGALPLFQGTEAQNSGRLALYRGNLSEHWSRTLAGAYPVLLLQLGEEFFYAMARLYGRQYPSDSGDLNRFGAHMADFLSTFEPVAPYPWLPDLARLEWALHLTHYAADGEPFDPACIAGMTPASMDSLHLGLHPACSLHAFSWDVVTLWQAHQQEPPAAWEDGLQKPVTALVYRAGWRAQVRALDSTEAAAIEALCQGPALGALLDGVLTLDPACDIGALFSRWLADHILQRTDRPL